MNLWATKSIALLRAEAQASGEGTLRKTLGALNLTTLGIGAIIGAGIFVLSGTVAATYTGPAVVLSFVLAGIGCFFADMFNQSQRCADKTSSPDALCLDCNDAGRAG